MKCHLSLQHVTDQKWKELTRYTRRLKCALCLSGPRLYIWTILGIPTVAVSQADQVEGEANRILGPRDPQFGAQLDRDLAEELLSQKTYRLSIVTTEGRSSFGTTGTVDRSD